MTDSTVELNQTIGYHLLNFVTGIDAISFVEAVNDSSQFSSIAKTLDHHFTALLKNFCHCQRIMLPGALVSAFSDDCEIDNERLVVRRARYSTTIEPSQRLFIHPCFSTDCFKRLSQTYRSPLFKCYSRLLPFNSPWYDADFGLVDFESLGRLIILERELNSYKTELFQGNEKLIKNV